MLKKRVAYIEEIDEDVFVLPEAEYEKLSAVMARALTEMRVAIDITAKIMGKVRGKSAQRRLAIASKQGDMQNRRTEALHSVNAAIEVLDRSARSIYPKYDTQRGFYFDKRLGQREHKLFLDIIDLQVFAYYWRIFLNETFGASGPITAVLSGILGSEMLRDAMPKRRSLTFFGQPMSLREAAKVLPRMVARYTDNRFLYLEELNDPANPMNPIRCLYTVCERRGNRVVFCVFNPSGEDLILDYALKPLNGNWVVDGNRFLVAVSDTSIFGQMDVFVDALRKEGAGLANRIFYTIYQRLLEELYGGDVARFSDDVYLQAAKVAAFQRERGVSQDIFPLFQETCFSPFYRSRVLDENEFHGPNQAFFSQFFEGNLTETRKRQLLFAFLFGPAVYFERSKRREVCFDPLFFQNFFPFVLAFLVRGADTGWQIDWENLWSRFDQVRTVIRRQGEIEVLDYNDLVNVMREALGVGDSTITSSIYGLLLDVGVLDTEAEFRGFWQARARGDVDSYFGGFRVRSDSVALYEDHFVSRGLLAREGREVALTQKGKLILSDIDERERESVEGALQRATQSDDTVINAALVERGISSLKLRLDDQGVVKVGRGLNNVHFDFGIGKANREIVLLVTSDRFLILDADGLEVLFPWAPKGILTDRECEVPRSANLKQDDIVLGFVFPPGRSLAVSNLCEVLGIVRDGYSYSQLPHRNTVEVYDGAEVVLDGDCLKVPAAKFERALSDEEKVRTALGITRTLSSYLGDRWMLATAGILEEHEHRSELLAFVGETEGAELEDEGVSETLGKLRVRVRVEEGVRRSGRVLGKLTPYQLDKIRRLLRVQVNSQNAGEVAYFEGPQGEENMGRRNAAGSNVGRKVAVAKVHKSQLHFDTEGQLCINAAGIKDEVVFVVFKDRKTVVLNRDGENISEEVRYGNVYRRLGDEGIEFVLDILDFQTVRDNLEILVSSMGRIRNLFTPEDVGVRDWLRAYGQEFSDDYFNSLEERIFTRCLSTVGTDGIRSNVNFVTGVVDILLQFFMSNLMDEAEDRCRDITPAVMDDYLESVFETVLVKIARGEIRDLGDASRWIDNVWGSFCHDYDEDRTRFSESISRVWAFPNMEMEERIYKFLSYFI